MNARDWWTMHNLMATAERLGLRITRCSHSNESLSFVPIKDALPTYSRDAEIASGSVEELESVLHGWQIAKSYYISLGIISDKSILAAENQIMEDRTAHKLRTGLIPKV